MQPGVGSDEARKAGAVSPAPAGPMAERTERLMLGLVLCLLFLGSLVISLTGLIFFIGWIVAL
jgi:hypothetical protein